MLPSSRGENIVEVEKNNQAQTTDKVAVKAEAKEAKAETPESKVVNKVKPTTNNMPVPADSSDTKEVSSKLQVREEKTLAMSGIRPIGASDLQIAETMSVSGIRPIGVSSFEVAETMNICGIRPIGANIIHVVDTMNLSGIRPIASSSLVVSESYSVMGNRPVASNDTDNSPMLMGYLD
jgi:hypothetical protein